MPISLSAKKSLRKSIKNRKVNVLFKNKIKTVTKKFLAKPTSEGLKEIYSIFDQAVKNNVFHKNKTARLKSNLAKRLANKDEVRTVVKSKKAAKKGSKKVAKSKVRDKAKAKSAKKM
ncbi:MAG: 30S ribosomal protein S20 [Candidatus Shapirobacteria bacterium]|nr:30S ribosomal protein S20 [Candidatus Shapirobacteria bacterium]